MKQIRGFFLCLVISILVAIFSDITIESDVSNTLFTIVGIMFSIGMSIAVTSNTSAVVNKKVTMFANANAMTTVGRRSLEALRLQPLGKPPQCFS